MFKQLATALNTEVHCAQFAIILDLFHLERAQVGGRAALCRSPTNVDHFQEAGRDGGDLENLQGEKRRLWGCCDPGTDMCFQDLSMIKLQFAAVWRFGGN